MSQWGRRRRDGVRRLGRDPACNDDQRDDERCHDDDGDPAAVAFRRPVLVDVRRLVHGGSTVRCCARLMLSTAWRQDKVAQMGVVHRFEIAWRMWRGRDDNWRYDSTTFLHR